MSGPGTKGTVTALDSLFSADEAQKAVGRVHDAVADRRNELDRLHGFIADNAALLKLVRDLPDDLSHQIMVPFGSAAFFPGRLIHTNEFLVLLGDGYYAERSGKQTAEILKRREKALEAQVGSLKATMLDLEAEAKFFGSTAAEAAEGLVEIREEYIEEPQIIESESANNSKMPDEDEEHARRMARLDELEKEEHEAGSDENEEAKEYARMMARLDELEKEELEAGSDEDEDAESDSSSQNDVSNDESEPSDGDRPRDPLQKSRGKETFCSTSGKPIGGPHQRADLSAVSGSNLQSAPKGPIESSMEQSYIRQKLPLPPFTRENLQKTNLEDSSNNVTSQVSEMGSGPSGGRKAFTGSVIEHSHGLPHKEASKNTTSNQPSKPVSRFKMQKGNC